MQSTQQGSYDSINIPKNEWLKQSDREEKEVLLWVCDKSYQICIEYTVIIEYTVFFIYYTHLLIKIFIEDFKFIFK